MTDDDFADALWTATVEAVPRWVERSVEAVAAQAGVAWNEAARSATATAAHRAAVVVGERLRQLLDTDVDEQRGNPLAILRDAVVFPTAVLQLLGVPPVRRRQFEIEAFPDDIYGMTPATWTDVDESLHEPGIRWGAWKAKTVLDRRRRQGLR
jgi:hypothetical protein